jgi:hypothetical protein
VGLFNTLKNLGQLAVDTDLQLMTGFNNGVSKLLIDRFQWPHQAIYSEPVQEQLTVIALDLVMDPKSNYRNETRERRAEVQLDAARAFSAKMKATLDEVRARKS